MNHEPPKTIWPPLGPAVTLRTGLRYASAIAAVAAGYALWWMITAWIGSGLPLFITFYPLVMAVALFGGLRPGLLATALTVVVVDVWILPPVGHLHTGSPVDRLALAVFAGMGLFISTVAELYRRSRQKAAAYDREQALREIQHDKEVKLRQHAAEMESANTELDAARRAALNLMDDAQAARQQAEQASAALRESEQRVRRKLESVLSPEGDLGVLELADLLDVAALQDLMDEFHAVTRIPMAIIDCRGRVLVGVGWQDICTRFHRVHPDSCRHCVESDTLLSAGLAQGQFRLYKCENNIWDMATPLIVAEQHLGNVFTGQFFLDDEEVDRELFRAQARRYGFDEAEYLAALDRAPRLSHETVERGISFLVKLADTISQLGYSNVKLARLLAERDRLTESLIESENRLKLAYQAARIGAFEWNVQTGVNVWTPELETMYGLAPGEFGRTQPAWEQLVHPEDRVAAVSLVDRAFETREPVSGEWRVVWRDGSVHWIHGRFQLFNDAAGRPLRLAGVNLDITDRMLAEQRLAYLASFPEKNPNPILEVALEGAIRYVNPTARRLFPDLEERGLAHPWLVNWAATTEPFRRGQTLILVREATGADRFWQQSLHFFPEERYVRIYGFDITELRRAKEALRESREDLARAQEVGQIGSWRLDVRSNVLTWSDETYRIFGVPQGTRQSYETFLQAIHPDDRTRVDAQWNAALRGEPYDIEHRILVGGETKWVREKAYLDLDDSGNLIGGFGITQDITEQKLAEDQLRATLAENEVLLKEIHHRVKNNMQVISSLVSLQADELPDPAMRAVLQDVTHRVRSMALVHEKLYQSPDMARVEFAQYAQSLLSYLWRAHATGVSGVQLVPDLEPVSLSINAAVPCGLILNELVSNALKHAFRNRTSPGNGQVTVVLRGGPDGQVSLCVRDNGTGLPPGADWRESRSLGLRLVSMLAGQLRASVDVVTGEGEGTEFRIVFGGGNR